METKRLLVTRCKKQVFLHRTLSIQNSQATRTWLGWFRNERTCYLKTRTQSKPFDKKRFRQLDKRRGAIIGNSSPNRWGRDVRGVRNLKRAIPKRFYEMPPTLYVHFNYRILLILEHDTIQAIISSLNSVSKTYVVI